MTVSYERALQLIQHSLDGLRRAGLIDQEMTAQEDLVVLGKGSPLDSVGFVTFVTELEDRLSLETGQDTYVILTDLHEYSPDGLCLSAGTFARYIVKLTEDQAGHDG